jgi:hypothetical protein
MPKHIWNEELLEELKKLVKIYTSNDKVAEVLGMSKNKIENALQTYKIIRENPKTAIPREIKYTKENCKYEHLDDCHIITSHSGSDSERPKIRVDGKPIIISRYIWELNYGKIPDGFVIRHKCDNGLCININHLEIGTQFDNIKDKIERGRQPLGSKVHSSKLTEEQVIDIKKRLENKESLSKIGELYGVGKTTISAIKNKINWQWL